MTVGSSIPGAPEEPSGAHGNSNDLMAASTGRLALRAAAILALALIASLTVPARPARAADHLRGFVVALLPDQHAAIVRHEPFGSMPGMTMMFAVEPASALARLHVGDRITARVDMHADPQRIDEIQVVGHAVPANTAASILHDVQPLRVGDTIPLATQFFDQLGRGFSFQDFRGQTLMLAFVYTRCQDPRMCPLISANFHMLQNKVVGLPIHLVEITLDPAYDTPDVLKRYGAAFGADPDRWTLGTGPISVVNDFAARFGIAVFHDPVAGLVHSEATAIIDPNGQIVDIMHEAAWSPDAVAAELESVAAVPSNPIARLEYELSKDAAALCGNSLPGTSGLLTLAFVALVLTGACWSLYRWAKIIFVDEPADKPTPGRR
jgi:protein SCO1/2